SAFLAREFPRMTDDEKLATLKDVFVEGFNGKGYLPFAFPGLDKMGFALGVLDAWARAGHPGALREERVNPLFEYVACPHPKNDRGDRSLVPHCDYHLYRFAMADPARTKRLVDAILPKNDAVLDETAFVAVRFARSGDALATLVTLWRAVDANPTAWNAAARVIAEELAGTSDRPTLVDEVRRQWRAHPDRRGALLYVLAEADPYGN